MDNVSFTAYSKVHESFCKRRAFDLISEGLKEASHGMHERAMTRFKASLRLEKTAEGYTYWAWMEAVKNNFHISIHLCREAIRLDPAFGNPYNDIGSYLVGLGNLDEALIWFEKAKKAERYGPKHYPYMNCGRIYRERGQYWQALREYVQAKKLAPQEDAIRAAIEELEKKII